MFCDWFKEIFKGHKQNEMAAKLGVCKSAVRNWLNDVEPHWSTAKEITKKMGYVMTVDGYSDFGEWLRVRRQENDISIYALSLDTGICAERIHSYENGCSGRLVTLAVLMDYFDATFSITKEIN